MHAVQQEPIYFYPERSIFRSSLDILHVKFIYIKKKKKNSEQVHYIFDPG